jgi:hypothetical protein
VLLRQDAQITLYGCSAKSRSSSQLRFGTVSWVGSGSPLAHLCLSFCLDELCHPHSRLFFLLYPPCLSFCLERALSSFQQTILFSISPLCPFESNLKQACVLTHFSHLPTFQSLNPFPQYADFIPFSKRNALSFRFISLSLFNFFQHLPTAGRMAPDGYYSLFKVGWSLARLVGIELN